MKNCFWKTYNLSDSSPPSKRTHGLPFSEKLLFNIQTAFKSVKVWLFCMILNNTMLNVDSISKKPQATLSNKKKKRSSTSWTIPLRVLFILAQGDTWFSQKTFFFTKLEFSLELQHWVSFCISFREDTGQTLNAEHVCGTWGQVAKFWKASNLSVCHSFSQN